MNYTSIEQSKKLVKLGLNPNTADMCYGSICYNTPGPYSGVVHVHKPDLEFNDLPCWSIGALLDLMPDSIGCWNLQVSTFYRGVWSCEYFSDGISAIKTSSPHLITAVYKMVILLLEQNYIKK